MYRFLQAGKKLKTLFHKKRTRSFELDFNYLIVRSNDRITFRSSAVQNHKGKSVNKERMALIVLVPIARHRPGTRAEKPQGQQRESSDHHSVTQSILSLSLKGFWCCAEDAVARVTIPCKGIEKVEKFRLFEAEKPRNSKRLARGTAQVVQLKVDREEGFLIIVPSSLVSIQLQSDGSKIHSSLHFFRDCKNRHLF